MYLNFRFHYEGSNAAIIHYKPNAETARTLNTDEIYLVDSGGQYKDGTTDVTRLGWMFFICIQCNESLLYSFDINVITLWSTFNTALQLP